MKAIFLFAIVLGLALAQNNPLDITIGGAYIATGTFTSYNIFAVPPYTPFGPPSVSNHTWISDPINQRIAQDIGVGGFYLYLPDRAYVVRGGVCFSVANYNYSVLVNTYGQATSFSFGDKADNITYYGLHSGTCRTPLSSTWRMGRNNIKQWTFRQKTALQIPAGAPGFPSGLNTCLNVRGDLDFSEITRYKNSNNPIPFPAIPSICLSSNLPDYCSNIYFPPGNQCDYGFYPYF